MTPVSVIEYVAPALVIKPSPEELSALESLQNDIHKKQMEVDRRVLVLKREKDKLRLLEECSFVPPHDLEVLRRRPSWQGCDGCRNARLACISRTPLPEPDTGAEAKTTQHVECFGTSSAPSSAAVKKAKKSRHQK